jgi:hypothetical protein
LEAQADSIMQAMAAKAGLVTFNFIVAISRPNHAENMANAASVAECSAFLMKVPRRDTVSPNKRQNPTWLIEVQPSAKE